MTNEIESLVKDIKACISDRDAMVEEQKRLKLEMANTIVNNYNTLFLPEADELHNLIHTLYKEVGYVQKYPRIEIICGDALLNINTNGDSTYFFYENKEHKTYHPKGEKFGIFYYPSAFVDYFRNEKWCLEQSAAFYKMLYEFFGTEDKTLYVLEKYKELVIMVLQSMHDAISARNAELAEKLDLLKTTLNNSHCVEEKSDGSIELTINGKTYIGTVKEA